MSRPTWKDLAAAAAGMVAFVAWTFAVKGVDLQQIGPEGTWVGLASLNGAFHELTGVNWLVYDITDWMGLIAILVAFGFAVIGFCQMVHRRGIHRVDADILILGVFYVLVIAGYLFFEAFPVNYRPVLVESRLEASYPSSTTLLVLCVMPTAIMQLRQRIHSRVPRRLAITLAVAFTAFMVVGRTICGVHWLTDIIGGVLLSFSLVMGYRAAVDAVRA